MCIRDRGKNPFTLTSKAVDNEKYQALLANETRYSRLTRAFPDRAKALFARNQEVANDRYAVSYTHLFVVNKDVINTRESEPWRGIRKTVFEK